MRSKLVATVTVAAVTWALVYPTGPALAADKPVYGDLTPEQKQAIAIWESPQRTATSIGPAGSTMAVRTTSTSRTSLYRGSWVMWANERVDFSSTSSSVSWSSGFQESGAVFPNNVTRNGTSRISSSSSKHTWRGSYTVGAGVPTPWGNANVYNATSTATTNVYRGNSWSASWSG